MPVDAELKNGVLTVKIDAPPQPEPKRVEIRSIGPPVLGKRGRERC